MKILRNLLASVMFGLAAIVVMPTMNGQGLQCYESGGAQDQCENYFGGSFIDGPNMNWCNGWREFTCCNIPGVGCAPVQRCCFNSGGCPDPPLESCGSGG